MEGLISNSLVQSQNAEGNNGCSSESMLVTALDTNYSRNNAASTPRLETPKSVMKESSCKTMDTFASNAPEASMLVNDGLRRLPLKNVSGQMGKFIRKSFSAPMQSTRTNEMLDSLPARCLRIYTRRIARHPRKFICVYFVLLVASTVIGFLVRPFELDTDFSAFIRADGQAMRRREAYLSALGEKKGINDERRLQDSWHDTEEPDLSDDDIIYSSADDLPVDREDIEKHSLSRGRQLQNVRYYTVYELILMYVGDHGDSLSHGALKGIRDFEIGLRSLNGWKLMCDENSATTVGLCNPGQTVASYAWPTKSPPQIEGQEFLLKFDANGNEMLPKPAFLSYLQQSSSLHHDLRRIFPKTFELPPVEGNVSIPAAEGVRSTFRFRIIVGGAGDSTSQVSKRAADLKEKYQTFIADEVYPYLSKADIDGCKVYYYGDHIIGYEIEYTIQKDALWAIGSMSFVMVYLYFHTRSKLLTVACLGIIFSSVPLAYAMTPASKVTIASFLSLFLITGIGSDVVFVFKDFWDRSALMTTKIDVRLAWMLVHAGKSCLATSLTTSVSFFANLASVLQPLREFGLFMGLCVMDAYMLVLLFLPPFFVICESLKNGQRFDQVSDEAMPLEGQIRNDDPEAFSSIVPALPEPKHEKKKSSDDVQSNFVKGLLLQIFDSVARRPKQILVFTFLMVVGFLIGVSVKAEMAEGTPEVFPSDHNQVKYEEWQDKFYTVEPLKTPASLDAAACAAQDPIEQPGYPCAVNWCEASSDTFYGTEDSTSGVCWRGPARVTFAAYPGGQTVPSSSSLANISNPWSTAECSQVTVKSKVAGLKAPASSDWAQVFFNYVAAEFNSTVSSAPNTRRGLKRLAFENWETGDVTMSNYFDMGNAVLHVNNWNFSDVLSVRRCEVLTVCSFGAQKCVLPNWQSLGSFSLTQPPTRRLHENMQTGSEISASQGSEAFHPRRLNNFLVIPQQSGRYSGLQIPSSKQTQVSLLFGIRPPDSTPLVGAPEREWSFDPTFEPQNPWAQRAMLDMCLNVRAELQVIGSDCWIYRFRIWMSVNYPKERFPSRSFDAMVALFFADAAGKIDASNNLWMENKVVKASKFEFRCNFNSDAAAADGIVYQDKWNSYVDNMNAVASLTANHAYATADVFKRSEAEEALIGSTIETIVIAAVLAWLGCAIFTGSVLLACLVTFLVLGIIAGLAFFMVVLCGWKIGPIEVVSLVVFMGYAVTYSLHIAHNYGEVDLDTKGFLEYENAWILKEKKRQIRRTKRRKMYTKSGNSDAAETQGSDADPSGSTENEQDDFMFDGIKNDDKDSLAALRRAKTRMAVLHVGGATMSSAASTLGSSFFLLFCTMNIFLKLGSVVIAVTLLSIVFALVPLQAVLMVLGPKETCFQAFHRSSRENVGGDLTDPRQPLVASDY